MRHTLQPGDELPVFRHEAFRILQYDYPMDSLGGEEERLAVLPRSPAQLHQIVAGGREGACAFRTKLLGYQPIGGVSACLDVRNDRVAVRAKGLVWLGRSAQLFPDPSLDTVARYFIFRFPGG